MPGSIHITSVLFLTFTCTAIAQTIPSVPPQQQAACLPSQTRAGYSCLNGKWVPNSTLDRPPHGPRELTAEDMARVNRARTSLRQSEGRRLAEKIWPRLLAALGIREGAPGFYDELGVFHRTPVLVFSNEPEINASAQWKLSRVILPDGMIQFLRDDESELAAVLAHELGHIIDAQCYQGDPHDRKSSEICEDRADSISITLLMKAHYNPYAAAGFMGKLMMFSGDTSVSTTFWRRMSSDHPASLDRIDHMRKTLIWACQQPWNNCQILKTGEEPSPSPRPE